MRVMLIQPASVVAEDALAGNNRGVVCPPAGLLSIAAALRARGHAVAVHDARLSARRTPLSPGRSLFGDPPADVAAAVADFRPDLVGLSANFDIDLPAVRQLAAELKRRLGVPVAVGGHAATAQADALSADDAIDFVIAGEGEHKLPLALDRLAGRAATDGKIIDGSTDACPFFIEKLDRLPLPAYDLADMERYFRLQRRGHGPRTREYGRRAASLFTSRGCPWNCGFCSIHGVMGRRFRAHGADYVLAHLRLLVERYGVDYVHFEDDNLTLDAGRFEAILAGLADLRPRVRWDTPNGVRADRLTADLVARAAACGCKHLVFGVESGVQRILDERIGKKLDLAAVVRSAQWCKRSRLEAQAFYVFGYPGETAADMEATARFALDLYRRLDVYPNVSIVLPLHGTRVRREAAERGWLVERGRAERIATDEFSPEDVDAIVADLRRRTLRTFARKAFVHPVRTFEYARIALRNPRIVRKLVRLPLGRRTGRGRGGV